LKTLLIPLLPLALLAGLAAPALQAQGESTPAETPQRVYFYKIGFVNTGTVLREAPQARRVEERLKSEDFRGPEAPRRRREIRPDPHRGRQLCLRRHRCHAAHHRDAQGHAGPGNLHRPVASQPVSHLAPTH